MSVHNFHLGEQVVKHPLNNSTAKAQYSFPRANRFFAPKPSNWLVPSIDLFNNTSIISNAAFYDVPNFRQTRSTSFGYGRKTDFTDTSKLAIPGPTRYSIESIFDNPGKKRNSITFGSRPVCSRKHSFSNF